MKKWNKCFAVAAASQAIRDAAIENNKSGFAIACETGFNSALIIDPVTKRLMEEDGRLQAPNPMAR